jgi:hypothetical protein
MRPSVAAVLFIAAPLHAGVTYDFVTTVDTPRGSYRQSGRISAQGQSYRADLSGRGGRDIDVVISRDGDQNAIFIDLAKCSWSYRSRIGPIRSSTLFHLPAADIVIDKPVVEHRVDGTESVAGLTTTRHVIDIRYRLLAVIAKTVVRGTITARATIWTADDHPALPMKRDLITGHDRVDELLANAAREIHGMVVRHELVVTRTFDEGIPQTERTVTTIDNVHFVDLPEELFATPAEAAYVQRAPGS